MAETKLQSRTLSKGPQVLVASNTLTPQIPKPTSNDVLPGLYTTQQTTSYRTVSRFAVEDPLSTENVNEFIDATGNGLAGERPLNQLSVYDNGHAFYTTKTFNSFSHPIWRRHWLTAAATKYMGYYGPLLPLNSSNGGLGYGTYPAAPTMSQSDINWYGTRAVNNTIPTAPGFSLATFLGELTEGLPSLFGMDTLKSRGDRVRASGGEYLNYQFGWVPLVSDLRKAAEAVVKTAKILRQFERDGGRQVRRSFTFPVEITSTPTTLQTTSSEGICLFGGGDMQAAFMANRGGRVPGARYHESISRREIWFKGAFEYAVIEGNTFSDKLARFEQEANILLGTRLTPEVLWNLAPWSWMADWFGNIGDVLSNATYLSSDGLVMRYGYLMCHTVAYNRYSIPDGAKFAPGLETGPIFSLFGRETKERVRATPYGFGLNPSGFSPKQWAILAALGMTRAPKVLF